MTITTMFVTVGTDHHPFDRLVEWADIWALANPGAKVIVQFGTSVPPRVATGIPALPHEEMLDYMREADVVVAQGGPGGIMDSRFCGKLPIVVPRHPAVGEHVDDHQLRFSAHMLAKGRITMALEHHEFESLVARALSHPDDFVVGAENSPTASTAATIEAALVGLLPGLRPVGIVPQPRRRLRVRRNTGLASSETGRIAPS